MANAIIDNPEDRLHTNRHALPLNRDYVLSPADRMSILMGAPGWDDGVGKSSITNAEIEAQRQAFISSHGSDGLN